MAGRAPALDLLPRADVNRVNRRTCQEGHGGAGQAWSIQVRLRTPTGSEVKVIGLKLQLLLGFPIRIASARRTKSFRDSQHQSGETRRHQGAGDLDHRRNNMAEKQKRIEKTREGVPIWDGDAGTYQEFEESALLWEQSIAMHKRYLCGPRLLTELTGTARRFTVGKHPEWLSFNGGVQRLLTYLRSNLGLPQMPELTDHLSRYFRQSRRKKGETMNEYVTRKSELYARARQGLHRVMSHYEKKKPAWEKSYGGYRRPGSTDPWANYRRTPSLAGSQNLSAEEIQDDREALARPDDQAEATEDATEERSSTGPGPSGDSWSYPDWWSNDWWSTSWTPSENADWNVEAPELLPEYVQGWYLLFDSGLDTNERNMVVAALKGDFTMTRVAQELRSQWTDEDLRRRDAANRHSSWWVDENEEAESEDYDTAWVAQAHRNFNDEGLALLGEAEDVAQEALAMMERGRRTLKEARQKQHQVRMSRKYYRTNFKPSGSTSAVASGTDQKCFRCGGPHKTSSCPKAMATTTASSAEEQAAPFICFAQDQITKDHEIVEPYVPDDHEVNYLDAGFSDACPEAFFDVADTSSIGPISTQMAVEQGKAVVDGGATKTLGSVVALEKIIALNKYKHGTSRLADLDLENKPTFGFGNSSKNQCVSTASLEVQADGKPGQVQVHALDAGAGPVLFSIESLRALGAIIDFSEDMVVFRKINPSKIIKMERSATGHQLLPMTQDWYSDAQSTAQPVPKELVEELLMTFGETAPKQWSIMEIESRLLELKEANGMITQKGKVRPPMRHAMIELNKASKKKSDLVDYVNNKLMVKTRGTETIQELQRLGTKKIYQTTAASPEDPVGFGEHCSLQYHELLAQHPQYASWVVKTATEGECDYRLARLANWLQSPEAQHPMPTYKQTSSGYKNTSTPASGSNGKTENMMMQMMQMMHALKEDVDNLKAERPHKKVEASSVCEMTESSTGSFVPIPQLISNAFEALLSHQRIELLEVACSADSVLSRTMQQKKGDEGAVGICEQAIQGTKTLMNKIAEDDPEVTAAEALAEATRTFNSRELIRGYSPIQHALGRAPDATGRLFPCGPSECPELLVENASGEMDRQLQRMQSAEKAFLEWTASQRLQKAKNSKPRDVTNYEPGDLVYVRRKQVSGQAAIKGGSFVGPARILAVEQHRSPDGTHKQGSSIWCVRGRRLLKCSPEQLRRASEREVLLEELHAKQYDDWDFDRVAQQLGGNEFLDVSTEANRAIQESNFQAYAFYILRSTRVTEEVFAVTESTFWMDETAAVAVEVPMPDTRAGSERALRDLPSYFASSLKKRSAVEVCERHLSEEERQQFRSAKAVEVSNFIAAKAFEALPEKLRPAREQAVKMRWILTWKQKEDGSRKAKARAVLLATTSPTTTRQTRQLQMQLAASYRHKMRKGDVTGAFLQSRPYPDDLFCIPCPEICERMGLPAESITKVKKACYGLVDAPLEWYRSISDFFAKLGLQKMLE
ncbi:unnamed protein product [Cladocopium goreaui]|uniref:Retrovirus-related Pol polyprotein from transposon RE1 (Retro element 1) (AtRE1) n=1 Tax=Cladocopium goreaui TaxID=2562237 RepID=A0A9P1D4J5_9DINO|nr:unnamed protein product [Cladocopium goreaui]